MVQTNNSELIREIQGATKIQTMQGLPTMIANQIVPVMEVNPKIVKNGICKSNSLTNGTTGTIYSTPSDQDFYITGANMTAIRDATATSTLFALTYVNEEGATINLLTFGGITLTAHSLVSVQTAAMHPIKCKRGSLILLTSGTNVANFKTTGQIYGFLDETSNA